MSLIVGISGKAGAGKDTVAIALQMIHYFEQVDMWGIDTKEITSKNFYNIEKKLFSIDKTLTYLDSTYQRMFQVIKFADPLKQMVALMLGVNVEQLENREFKESELDENWWKYVVRETFNYLENKGNFSDLYLEKLTPRKILQLMGTEVGRNIHPNVWVNIAMQKADKSDKIVLIPDMRFKNEMKAVQFRRGITVRVNRNVETGTHPSETELDNESFDFVIDNNGSLDDLIAQCHKLYKFIKENCI
jgi:dephospho-CoA kinase